MCFNGFFSRIVFVLFEQGEKNLFAPLIIIIVVVVHCIIAIDRNEFFKLFVVFSNRKRGSFSQKQKQSTCEK